MLADQVDHVIGIDTHRDQHAVAVCNTAGGVVAETVVGADVFGYRRRLRFAGELAPGRRVWAVEGTGSFGAGHTIALSRLAHHPETRRYAARRATPREIKRCLKRHPARRIFHILESGPAMT